MSKQKHEKVKVFALGGVGELGKNMTVVEVGDDIIVMDTGIMFPEDDMLGVDIVIPDITYLQENVNRVRGIFLTHGHEDHIGALPYVLEKLNVPVYGTQLTMAIIKYKLKDAGLLKSADLRLIDPEQETKVGNIRLSFFRTNHSIPDSIGMCIHTSKGAIVNTGDFKFDYTPVDHKDADIRRMASIGEEGVLCLLSDSTNAEYPGLSGSEATVGQDISDTFYLAENRIIVASIASNIHRLQQVFDAAAENNRRVAVVGRDIEKIVDIAWKLGYLNIQENVYSSLTEINKLSGSQAVLLISGSKGEPVSALSQMMESKKTDIQIQSNDTVLIADEPAVGNEKTVSAIIDKLVRAGAHVVDNWNKSHISDHGAQEELKLMLQIMSPKYFIPIHGEYRMLKTHSDLARKVGIADENIYILDKGECIEFIDGEAKWGGKMPSGNVLVDGIGIGDVGNIVLRDRKLLSEDGVLFVVVTLGKKSKSILSGPEIISRGFVYVRESEQLLQEASQMVSESLKTSLNQNISEWSSLKSGIRDSLSRYLFDKTRRRPMILPIIMEVKE